MDNPVFAKRERDLVVTGSAVFLVEVEIPAQSNWTRDTTHAQIDTQVLDSARERFQKLLAAAREYGIEIKLASAPVHVRTVVEYRERRER